LRHGCAVALLQAGVDLTVIRDYLGHASVATTRRYLSATGQGLRHVIQAHPGQAALRETLSKTR